MVAVGGVMVASWWRCGGVVVASWWRHSGVMVALVYARKPDMTIGMGVTKRSSMKIH